MIQSVIKVTGLTKQFQNITAVDDLSFSVEEGDVYGFLGQNGAGKSTTIRMLLTLIKPTSGNIKLFGMPLHSHRNEILRQIGAVVEKPDVYKYLSAYENLELFAKLSGIKVSKQMLIEQLEMVGLAGRANDDVKTYSQGMKQRLGIAIALVHDPKLIILDEPTNGLDPQGIADIRNLILYLSHEKKKTIVVSSHLLNEIEQVATKVLIIDKGKKIIEGLSSQLFDPLETLVEVETVDNIFSLQCLEQSSWKDSLQNSTDKILLLKMDKQLIPQLIRDLVNMNVQVISLKPRHKLEDYFLKATSGNQHVNAWSGQPVQAINP